MPSLGVSSDVRVKGLPLPVVQPVLNRAVLKSKVVVGWDGDGDGGGGASPKQMQPVQSQLYWEARMLQLSSRRCHAASQHCQVEAVTREVGCGSQHCPGGSSESRAVVCGQWSWCWVWIEVMGIGTRLWIHGRHDS